MRPPPPRRPRRGRSQALKDPARYLVFEGMVTIVTTGNKSNVLSQLYLLDDRLVTTNTSAWRDAGLQRGGWMEHVLVQRPAAIHGPGASIDGASKPCRHSAGAPVRRRRRVRCSSSALGVVLVRMRSPYGIRPRARARWAVRRLWGVLLICPCVLLRWPIAHACVLTPATEEGIHLRIQTSKGTVTLEVNTPRDKVVWLSRLHQVGVKLTPPPAL